MDSDKPLEQRLDNDKRTRIEFKMKLANDCMKYGAPHTAAGHYQAAIMLDPGNEKAYKGYIKALNEWKKKEPGRAKELDTKLTIIKNSAKTYGMKV